jgi:hypothetical protein
MRRGHQGHGESADSEVAVLGSKELGDLRRLADGLFPALGFFDEESDHDPEQGRDQAAEEYIAPGELGGGFEVDALDLIGHEGGEKEGDGSRRVEQRTAFDAAFFRDDLGDHRGSSRPLASDAKSRDEAADNQDSQVWRSRAESRAEGVDGDREEEGSAPADAVADAPEDDAAKAPSDEEHGGEDARPEEGLGLSIGAADFEAEQGRDAVGGYVVEEDAIKGIESPADPGGKEDGPLKAGEIPQLAVGVLKLHCLGETLPN